ncbi:hypothetical protein AAFF_G00149390 [Aldrovandia affinis]|uniref:Uncharacterized protein n=1 Tax=Aldrovandia affinis TaxID=143900 RepID=A0AAD7R0T8_9TELE|nr:hypothetical protein AAFF_G00149390 [Aldrovandia affinis]
MPQTGLQNMQNIDFQIPNIDEFASARSREKRHHRRPRPQHGPHTQEEAPRRPLTHKNLKTTGAANGNLERKEPNGDIQPPHQTPPLSSPASSEAEVPMRDMMQRMTTGIVSHH